MKTIVNIYAVFMLFLTFGSMYESDWAILLFASFCLCFSPIRNLIYNNVWKIKIHPLLRVWFCITLLLTAVLMSPHKDTKPADNQRHVEISKNVNPQPVKPVAIKPVKQNAVKSPQSAITKTVKQKAVAPSKQSFDIGEKPSQKTAEAVFKLIEKLATSGATFSKVYPAVATPDGWKITALYSEPDAIGNWRKKRMSMFVKHGYLTQKQIVEILE